MDDNNTGEVLAQAAESEAASAMPRMTMRKPSVTMPEMSLAMAYVPLQRWEEPYPAETALDAGTIFRSLDKPFAGSGAMMGGGAR